MNNPHKSFFSVTLVALLLLCLPLLTTMVLDQDSIDSLVNTYKPNTLTQNFAFVGAFVVFGAVGLPRQVIAVTFGFLFGAVTGTVLATTTAAVAAVLTYAGCYYFARPLAAQKFPDALTKVQQFFSQDTFIKAIAIRLLPAGSNFLTNVLAGSSKAPVVPYFFGTTIGFIPQMTLFCLLGSGIKVGNDIQILVTVCMFMVSSLLIGYLLKKAGYRIPRLIK